VSPPSVRRIDFLTIRVVKRLANKRCFGSRYALTARLDFKKFFIRFCSDEFLVKGFLARDNLRTSPAGGDDTRRTEDLIESTSVTCVGVDFEHACINVAQDQVGRARCVTKAMPVELPVTDVSGSRWSALA
jgi:hypothetical protein